MDEDGKAGEMQRPLDAQDKELASKTRGLGAKEADVKENAHNCGLVELELTSAWAAISTVREF